MPCRQRPAGGFVAVVTKQIEAGRALTDIYPARFLHLVQKGGRHVQAADPAFRSFYLFPPFTVRAALHRHHAVHLHLRHRAALGISQETDAIAVVVSEETGNISVAMNGKFKLRLSTKELEQILTTA